MVINAALAIGLAPVIGYLAAAIGATLASWGMVALLWLGSRKMGVSAQLDRRFRKRIWRITVASILMGVALIAAQLALNPMFGAGAWRYLALALLVLIGVVSYFGIGQLLGAFKLSDFRRSMRR